MVVNLRMQNDAKAGTLEFQIHRPAGPPVLGTWHMGTGAVQLRKEGNSKGFLGQNMARRGMG